MKRTIVILACAALVACAGKQEPAPQQAAQPKTSLPPALHQALPPSGTSQTSTETAAANSGGNFVSGKILETMNSGGYTYLRIATPAGDQWAAVRETTVKKGANVAVAVQMVADNFESKTLNRKFDHIIFGTIAGDTGAAMPPNAMAGAIGSPAEHMKAAAVDTANISVEKAPGGKSVAEVWAEKSELKDKPVTIRGKVVKFLPEIMGKNWLHLRDGSGSHAKGNDDITVTTNEMFKPGEVITVTGTLRLNKDFGAGYSYPVIVEDAKAHP